MRVLRRENWKEFWRAFPPLEKWLRPRGYAEPDPPMVVGAQPWFNPFAKSSAQEDKIVTLKEALKSPFFWLFSLPVSKFLNGKWPGRFVDDLLEEAIKRREDERRNRKEPGTLNRDFKTVLLAHLPGWNHATHLYEYGRRDDVTRTIAEEDEIIARVPMEDDKIDAIPSHIQLLHQFRSLPDPIHSLYAHIPRDNYRDALSLFLKGDHEAAGRMLPDELRTDNKPPVHKHWEYYFSPATAYEVGTTPRQDPLEEFHQMQAQINQPGFMEWFLRMNPEEAKARGFDKQTRQAQTIDEQRKVREKEAAEMAKKPFATAWDDSFGAAWEHAKDYLNPKYFGPYGLWQNVKYLYRFHSTPATPEQRQARDNNPHLNYSPDLHEAIQVFKTNYDPVEHLNMKLRPDELKKKAAHVKDYLTGKKTGPPPKQGGQQRRSFSTATTPAPKESSEPEITPGAHLHKLGHQWTPPVPKIGDKLADKPRTLKQRFERLMNGVGERLDAWYRRRQEYYAEVQRNNTHPMDIDYSKQRGYMVMYPAQPEKTHSRWFLEWRLLRDRHLRYQQKLQEEKQRLDPSYDPEKRPLSDLKAERLQESLSWLVWYGKNFYDHVHPEYSPESLHYDPTKLPKMPEVVIDWSQVPEEIIWMYKVLKQWDHIIDADELPVEYYEFVWLIHWIDEGYHDIELPERADVMMLQRAPQFLHGREAERAHEWLLRKDTAEGNRWKMLLTGPEPRIPELEAWEEKLQRSELPPSGSEHAIYVVGQDEIPQSLLLAAGIPLESVPTPAKPALSPAQQAAAEAAAAAAGAPKKPRREEDEDEDEEEDEEDEEALEAKERKRLEEEARIEQEALVRQAQDQQRAAEEALRKATSRKKRGTGDDVFDSMALNRRDEAAGGASGLVLRRDEDGPGQSTNALASFLDSFGGLTVSSGDPRAPAPEPAATRRIARDMFGLVGEVIDFQTYVRKFYPAFDLLAWEVTIKRMLCETTEDLMNHDFNIPRLMANTAVYNKWLDWSLMLRYKYEDKNLLLPHMISQTAPTVRKRKTIEQKKKKKKKKKKKRSQIFCATLNCLFVLVLVDQCRDDGWHSIRDLHVARDLPHLGALPVQLQNWSCRHRPVGRRSEQTRKR